MTIGDLIRELQEIARRRGEDKEVVVGQRRVEDVTYGGSLVEIKLGRHVV